MTTSSSSVAGSRSGAKGRAVRVTPRAAVLLVVVMLLGLALVYPARLYLDQRGKVAELQRQTQELSDQKALLSRQIDQLGDPAYLERLARECLGMVRPGETAFVVVPKGEDPEPVSC
jgi:cell division protein FtsB